MINLSRRPDFHNFSRIHDCNPVRNFCHHTQVMAYKNRGGSQLFLKTFEQIQNLCLNRHIKSRGGLVGKQNVRIARKGYRHHNPLPLSS